MHGSLPAVCMQLTVTSYCISLALASAAHMCCSTMIALTQTWLPLTMSKAPFTVIELLITSNLHLLARNTEAFLPSYDPNTLHHASHLAHVVDESDRHHGHGCKDDD